MEELYNIQTNNLATCASTHCGNHGVDICVNMEKSTWLLLEWVTYLKQYKCTGNADCLLDGILSAAIEVVGCTVLGLIRPTLFSMRAEIDMLLGWIFFKDHPAEWQLVEETGNGFKLKKALLDYLTTYNPNFKPKFAILSTCITRSQEDPYRLLSAHIHSQTSVCVPASKDLASLVDNSNLWEDCVKLQLEVSEYLNDILFSLYSDNTFSLPDKIVNYNKMRMSDKQKKAFFS